MEKFMREELKKPTHKEIRLEITWGELEQQVEFQKALLKKKTKSKRYV